MAGCWPVKVKASASSSDRATSVGAERQVMAVLAPPLICVHGASVETSH